MGTLSVVATPIGNLEDLSTRAHRVLAESDLILCEDTRVTRKLLSAFDIHVPVQSLHQHSTSTTIRRFVEMLDDGKHLALVTDAGTPGISDPGGKFIEAVVHTLGNNVKIEAIPGACAAIAALSVSGFPTDRFRFMGFPPQKNSRRKYFEEITAMPETVVFYESIHRLRSALETLIELTPHRPMLLARELTKMHETLYRGTPAEILAIISPSEIRGECVFVLAPLS